MEKTKMTKNEAVAKLLGNRGFYILLALGLAIVGATGYVRNYTSDYEDGEKAYETSAQIPLFAEPPSVPAIAQVIPEKQPVTKKETVKKVATTSTKPATTSQKLMLPLQGEMTKGFSADALVYNKTMQDWRIHSGIDIRGDVGMQVKSASDGVVTGSIKDEMMGASITIKGSNGIETEYSNLQSNDLVKAGQAVKRGEVIGGVGATASSEIAEPPHLHFAVKKDGKYVNPFDFMD